MSRAIHLTRTDAEVFEAEAYRYYTDGFNAEALGDKKLAARYYELAESYLKDAGIPFTGQGAKMSWSF